MREYLRGDRFVYREVAGEHLLIAIHKDRMAPLFMFTPTGAAIWQRLESWSSPEVLVDYLLERFEVDRDRAAVDVAEFLQQLEVMGAVQERESA